MVRPRFASARIMGAPIEPKYKTRTGLLLFWMRRNVGLPHCSAA
jgi:hypothetical protein